jgi:hypothetical protein
MAREAQIWETASSYLVQPEIMVETLSNLSQITDNHDPHSTTDSFRPLSGPIQTDGTPDKE